MCENLLYLNLHDIIRDSYIIWWMSGLRFAVEGRSQIAVTHLALLGVKLVGTALWEKQKKQLDLEFAV